MVFEVGNKITAPGSAEAAGSEVSKILQNQFKENLRKTGGSGRLFSV